MADYTPTSGMKEEAQRGLDWRREFGRGGTAVGIARARDITNGKDLPLDTVKRMFSFFSRHEVDKKAEGFSPGEDGFPSNGRIAWALWGGDAGFSWSRRIIEAEKDERAEKRPYPNEHAARLKDPAQYEEFRRETDAGGAGVDFIYGIKEGEAEIQAIRFDAERFTSAEARTWLEEHDFEPIEFEEATMEERIDKRHIIGVMETDDAFVISYSKHSEDYEEQEGMDEEQPEMEMATERKLTTEPLTYRTGEVERGWSQDKEDRRVRLAWSSQTPVEREFGYEVLGHSAEEIDMSFAASGRMPLLLDHDMRQQIGVVEQVSLDSQAGIARATVRFGKSALAEEVYQDVKDNIRTNVSVGYSVKAMVPTDEEIDGRGVYRVSQWFPQEISIVSVPADKGVGVGRSLESLTESTKMENKIINEVQPQPVLDEKAIRQNMLAEQNKMRSLAEGFGKAELAEKAIRDGQNYLAFAESLSQEVRTNPHSVQPDLSKKERQQYSLLRAIQAQASNDWSKAGFEREISNEIAQRTGKEPRGFYMLDGGFQTQKRTLTAVTGSSGSGYGDYTVAENLLTDRFIDALISVSILGQVGATRFEGLVGDVKIPKFSANASVTFQTETGSVANNEPDFGQISMSPKTAANKIAVSRQLLHQGLNGNLETTLRNHMVRLFAAKLDNVAIKGGGSNEPTGILGTSGIGDVESAGTSGNAALTYGNCLDIWSEVAADNALLGSLYWVTHPRVVAKLMQTLVASSTDSRMVMMEPDMLLGYPLVQTTQSPGTGNGSSTPYSLLFGNFSDLYLGFFGSLDVLVDPYGAAGTSIVNLYFYQMMDVAIARPESFSAAQDLTV